MSAIDWRSYRVAKYGEPLELFCGPMPDISGSEVLVKVTACGVCHSDLHIIDGYFDLGNGRKTTVGQGEANLPLTPGHEIVGEVVAVGADVSDVKVGDRRIVYPWIGCGRPECFLCSSGQEHMCGARALGMIRHGGYSSYVVVPESKYLVEYGGIPDPIAATYACSGLTAYSSLKKAGTLGPGEQLLIIGAGGVGTAAISLAKEVTGVAPVVAEIDPTKADAALRAGASSVIDPSLAGAAKDFVKGTGGATVILDFVGSEQSARFATSALRRTGKLIIVGLFGGTFQMPVAFFPLLGLTIEGTQVGTLEELKELVELGRAGRFRPIPTASRPLDQANASLQDLRGRRVVGRIVLEP
jgi:D-arabinose 1-dehydrogenase-like Zn-dependent alcohol dehydrogenase